MSPPKTPSTDVCTCTDTHCSLTDLCLDQVIALGADVFEEAQDVHCAFLLYLLQHAVNHNICARSPNASTTQTGSVRQEMQTELIQSQK